MVKVKRPKVKIRKPKVRVRKVTLAKNDVVKVVAHKDVHPAVVHVAPGVVEVRPVPKEQHKSLSQWFGWLFHGSE
jgi:hypothetical protein